MKVRRAAILSRSLIFFALDTEGVGGGIAEDGGGDDNDQQVF
jgi:hypothetical protein